MKNPVESNKKGLQENLVGVYELTKCLKLCGKRLYGDKPDISPAERETGRKNLDEAFERLIENEVSREAFSKKMAKIADEALVKKIDRFLESDIFSRDTLVRYAEAKKAALEDKEKKKTEVEPALKALEAEFLEKLQETGLKANFGSTKRIFDKYVEPVVRKNPEFIEKFGGGAELTLDGSFDVPLSVPTGLYLNQYRDNRKVLFEGRDKSGSFAKRTISDNLETFFVNSCNFKKISEKYPFVVEELNADFQEKYPGISVADYFEITEYNRVLSGKGILLYNILIGGYTKEDGVNKVKGFNERLNEIPENINVHGKKKKPKLFLVQLDEQILTKEKDEIYQNRKRFEDDQEAISTIVAFNEDLAPTFKRILDSALMIDEDTAKECKFTQSGFFNVIFKAIYGQRKFMAAWHKHYNAEHPLIEGKRGAEKKWAKEKDKIKAAFMKTPTVPAIEACGYEFTDSLRGLLVNQYDTILIHYNNLMSYVKEGGLPENSVRDKTLLELAYKYTQAVLQLRRFVNSFFCEDAEDYEAYEEVIDELGKIVVIDGRLKAYKSLKNTSGDNVSICADCSEFGGGWTDPSCKKQLLFMVPKNTSIKDAVHKPHDYRYWTTCPSLESDFQYPKYSSEWPKPENDDDIIFLMTYYQWDTTKGYATLFENDEGEIVRAVKGAPEGFHRPAEVDRILKKRKDDAKYSYNNEENKILITYFGELIQRYLKKYKGVEVDISDISNIKKFPSYLDALGNKIYRIGFVPVSKMYVEKCIFENKFFAFEFDCRQKREEERRGKISSVSRSYETLLELFSVENRSNSIFKLNGGLQVNYRLPIPNSEKRYVYKNKGSVSLVLSYNINYGLIPQDKERSLNHIVRDAIRTVGSQQTVIGVDRGSRNLLTYFVLRGNKKLEEGKINVINNIDYRKKLVAEDERVRKLRSDGVDVDSKLKNYRDAYFCDAIWILLRLAIKYDAVVVLENPKGYKDRNIFITNPIFQNKNQDFLFKSLFEKGDYTYDKNKDKDEIFGLRRGLQLANSTRYKDFINQNGIFFVVDPRNTSSIDPVTGYFPPSFCTYDKSKSKLLEIITSFEDIRFVPEENMFRFTYDMKTAAFGPLNDEETKKRAKEAKVELKKTRWEVWSNDTRICEVCTSVNDFGEENRKSVELDITEELKKFFDNHEIEYADGEDIRERFANSKVTKEDIVSFVKILRNVFQVRNAYHERTGKNADVDYILSPVKQPDGTFFDSRLVSEDDEYLPCDGDSNGALNIARKGAMLLDFINSFDENETYGDKMKIRNTDLVVDFNTWVNAITDGVFSKDSPGCIRDRFEDEGELEKAA